MSHEEEAIAKAQANAAKSQGADGLKQYHNKTIAGLDERIVVFVLAVSLIGLLAVWTLAESPLVLYGSLILVIVLLVLWGVIRIKRINKIREQRAKQAASWKSKQ